MLCVTLSSLAIRISFCSELSVGTVTLATTCGKLFDTVLDMVNDPSEAGATA